MLNSRNKRVNVKAPTTARKKLKSNNPFAIAGSLFKMNSKDSHLERAGRLNSSQDIRYTDVNRISRHRAKTTLNAKTIKRRP